MNTLALEKYNIRDTKRLYSLINDKVLQGIEVITYNAVKKGNAAEVSHIKTEVLDHFCDRFFVFSPIKDYDKELKVWTAAVNEINVYGEGSSLEEAIENLIDSVLEFESIYLEKIELFSKVEDIEKQFYMRKIIRCEGDREKLRKALGL